MGNACSTRCSATMVVCPITMDMLFHHHHQFTSQPIHHQHQLNTNPNHQSPPNLQSHTPHQNPDTHRSHQLNSLVNTPLTQVHLRLSSIALGTTATTMMALTAAIAPMASAVWSFLAGASPTCSTRSTKTSAPGK